MNHSTKTFKLSIFAGLDCDSATFVYSLIVRVTDSSNNIDIPVSVVLSPVNEATPTFSPAAQKVTIAEDINVGTLITTYTATDTDHAPHNINKYEITSGKSLLYHVLNKM